MFQSVRAPQAVGDGATELVDAELPDTVARGGGRYGHGVLERGELAKTLTFIIAPYPRHNTTLLLHRPPSLSTSNATELWFA